MDTNSINLLRTQSVLSQEEMVLLGKIRMLSIGVFVFVLIIGLFVGASYLAGNIQYNALTSKRTTLSQQMSAQAKKQILLLSLKDRIPIIQKTLDSQYPWDIVIQNIVSIVAPPFLKTIAIGQNNILVVSAKASSLEDVQKMIEVAVAQTQAKKIRSPQITSLQVSRDGSIEVTFTFIPIL